MLLQFFILSVKYLKILIIEHFNLYFALGDGSESHEFRSWFFLVVGKQRGTENAQTGHQYNIFTYIN